MQHPNLTSISDRETSIEEWKEKITLSELSVGPEISSVSPQKKRDRKETAKERRVKVHWSLTEDSKLSEGLQLFGRNAAKLAKFIGSRDLSQVRYRLGYIANKHQTRRRA